MCKLLYKIIFFTIGIVLLNSSCNKLFPFSFSEGNNILNIDIKNYTEGIQLGTPIINPNEQDELNGEYGSVVLVVNKGNEYFPLVIRINEMILSEGAVIRNFPENERLSLAFITASDKKEFYIVSPHGDVKKWVISILDRTPQPADPNNKNTNILSFNFTPDPIALNTKEALNGSDIAIKDDSILLVYYTDTTEPVTFPITLQPKITIPAGAYLPTPADTNAMSFSSLKDVKTITVMAADSLKKQAWYVALKEVILAPPPTGSTYSDSAEIKKLSISNYSPATFISFGDPVIDASTNTIYLPEYTSYSFSKNIVIVVGNIALSDNAKISSDYTGSFSFSSFTDTKSIVVIAESGKQKTWKLRLLYSPQITNSGFEDWTSRDGYAVISGGQWIANNFLPNSMVSSVSIVNPAGDAFAGSKCAEISTRYIVRGAAGVNSITPVSGGMVFLGSFNFSASEAAIRNPLSSYSFGVSYIYSPTYIKLALKYIPYTPAIQASIKNFSYVLGNAVPNFDIKNTGNTDKCDITINIYDVDGNKIGSANYTTDQKISDWKEVYIPIVYTSTTSAAKMDIRFSSSQGGLNYLGGSGATDGSSDAIGSKLYIDDIQLWYTPVSTMPKN